MLQHHVLDNSLNAQNTSKFYDDFWKDYQPQPTQQEQARADTIQNFLTSVLTKQSYEILDFGCGRGWMAPFLSPWGTVTGIDFSAYGIDFARQYYSEHGCFLLADSTNPTLGIPSEKRFDVVVSSEVIEHVVDQNAYLTQIWELLQPNGWCVLTTPNRNVWKYYAQQQGRANLQPIENWLSPPKCRQLFSQSGFRVLRHQGILVGMKHPIYKNLLFRAIRKWSKTQNFTKLDIWLTRAVSLYQCILAQKISNHEISRR